jgi:hypothetical protein
MGIVDIMRSILSQNKKVDISNLPSQVYFTKRILKLKLKRPT